MEEGRGSDKTGGGGRDRSGEDGETEESKSETDQGGRTERWLREEGGWDRSGREDGEAVEGGRRVRRR